jgi:hypothetical protein
MNFVYLPAFKITKKHSISETGSVSVFSEGRETLTLLDPLEGANLSHWTFTAIEISSFYETKQSKYLPPPPLTCRRPQIQFPDRSVS